MDIIMKHMQVDMDLREFAGDSAHRITPRHDVAISTWGPYLSLEGNVSPEMLT